MCMLGLRIANRLPNRFNPVFVELSKDGLPRILKL